VVAELTASQLSVNALLAAASARVSPVAIHG
jgi:hypothetical protein